MSRLPDPYRVLTLMPVKGCPTRVQAATHEDEFLLRLCRCYAPEFDMRAPDWIALVGVLAKLGVMILLDPRS